MLSHSVDRQPRPCGSQTVAVLEGALIKRMVEVSMTGGGRDNFRRPWWQGACCAGLFGAGLMGLCLPAQAVEHDAAVLLDAPDGLRRPADPLRLRIPGFTADTRARFVIELDDVDVSDVVEAVDGVLLLRPVQALAPGMHTLRLVENTPEGEIIERGAWRFEVRASAWFREARGGVDGSFSAIGRVAVSGLEETPDATQSEGAAQLQGVLADGAWRASASADLIHHSDPAQLPRGEGAVDLGDFIIEGKRGAWRAALGHQSPAENSLIVQDLRRRGVAAGYGGQDDAVRVTAFALRAQEVAGFQGGLGTGRTDNRISGVTLGSRPLAVADGAMVVSATWLEGRDPGQDGEGVGGESGPVSAGRAATVAADGQWLDERLRLRTELSETRFDFDGDGGEAPEQDRAATALLTWKPLADDDAAGESTDLLLGIERRRLGTFYRSIGDPAGVADRDLLRAFGEFARAGWAVQASLGEETDNVNDLPQLPRIRSVQSSLSLAWTPMAAETETETGEAVTPWYGQPAWSFSYVDYRQEVEREGAGLKAGRYRATRTLALSASFSYAAWSWGISHTLGGEDDFAGTGASSDNTMTELAFNLDAESGLSLGINLQRSITRDRVAGIDNTTDTLGMDVAWPLRDDLAATLAMAYNSDSSSDGSMAVRSFDVSGALRWTLREANEERPGLSLSVDWQHQRQRDAVDPEADTRSNQIFFRLTMSWASNQ